MDKHTLHTLGQHLQAIRIERGLSLSQLAADAGIAKSNLSRLEQGSGNPTIDTIWRLAVQLGVPFSELVAPIKTPFGEEGLEVQLIAKGNNRPRVDAYYMSMAPNIHRQAHAHTVGSTETITMVSGELLVGPADSPQRLISGQSITFNADQPHGYQTEQQWATFLITIVYHTEDSAS